MKRLLYKINDFFFNLQVKDTVLLSKIIIGFALLNIIILLPDAFDIFSTNGFIPNDINDVNVYAYDPILHWLINPLTNLGLTSNYAFFIVVSAYIASLFLAFTQYKTLFFSVTAWIIHVMLINSSYCFAYGADYFITFSLFINILLNLNFIKNPESKNALNSFTVRMVQIQLCIIYFFAGFGKAVGVDWLDGNAMWYVLNTYSPEFIKSALPPLIEFPFVFQFLCWSTIGVELLYPILVFTKRFRTIIIYSAILMHIGIMIFMGLYTFGMVMIMLNIVGFGYYLKPAMFLKQKIDNPTLVPAA